MRKLILILMILPLCSFSQLDDATKHMAVSHALSTTIGVTVYEITESPLKAIVYSFIGANIIGFGKELHDKYIKGTQFSWRDIGNNNWGITISTITLIPYIDQRQRDKRRMQKFRQFD